MSRAIRRALWPEDTFVDVELGVNSVIRQLRSTLGDDATEPRYIEARPAPPRTEEGMRAGVHDELRHRGKPLQLGRGHQVDAITGVGEADFAPRGPESGRLRSARPDDPRTFTLPFWNRVRFGRESVWYHRNRVPMVRCPACLETALERPEDGRVRYVREAVRRRCGAQIKAGPVRIHQRDRATDHDLDAAPLIE